MCLKSRPDNPGASGHVAEATEHQQPRLENTAARVFMTAISAVGLSVLVYAAFKVVTGKTSLDWILLSLVTTLVVGRTSIRIPRMRSTVTLDDTFIFLSVLLYGVWPSVVLAGVNVVSPSYCQLIV